MSHGHSEGIPAGVIIITALTVIWCALFTALLFNWHARTGEPSHEGIYIPIIHQLEDRYYGDQ